MRLKRKRRSVIGDRKLKLMIKYRIRDHISGQEHHIETESRPTVRIKFGGRGRSLVKGRTFEERPKLGPRLVRCLARIW